MKRRILLRWLLVDWGPVSRALPAPADLCQSEHETRQSQEGPSQQDDAGQDEGQQVHRGEVVRVSPGEEGEVPAEEESVHDGESQGSVAESGLQTHTEEFTDFKVTQQNKRTLQSLQKQTDPNWITFKDALVRFGPLKDSTSHELSIKHAFDIL